MKKMQNLVKEAFGILELLKKYDSCSLKPFGIICIEKKLESDGDVFEEETEEETDEDYVGQKENPFYFEPYDLEEKKQIALFTVVISNYGVSWDPEKEESVVINACGRSFRNFLEDNPYIAMMTEALRIKDELTGSKDDGERRKVAEVKLTMNRVKPVNEWYDSDNSRSYWDYLERSRYYDSDSLPPPPSYTLEKRVAIADMVVALCDCDCDCDSKIVYKICNDVVTIRLGFEEYENEGYSSSVEQIPKCVSTGPTPQQIKYRDLLYEQRVRERREEEEQRKKRQEEERSHGALYPVDWADSPYTRLINQTGFWWRGNF